MVRRSLIVVLCAVIAACTRMPAPRSPALGMLLPPQSDQGYVRAFCHEAPAQGVIGCGYIGYTEGRLCMFIVESTHGGPWVLRPDVSSCEIELFVGSPTRGGESWVGTRLVNDR